MDLSDVRNNNNDGAAAASSRQLVDASLSIVPRSTPLEDSSLATTSTTAVATTTKRSTKPAIVAATGTGTIPANFSSLSISLRSSGSTLSAPASKSVPLYGALGLTHHHHQHQYDEQGGGGVFGAAHTTPLVGFHHHLQQHQHHQNQNQNQAPVETSFVPSKLIRVSLHEVENKLELSLRQAYENVQPKLRPPFSLEIPESQEYLELNRAIVYGILCEPNSSKTHIKHLHALVTDGYAFFTSLLIGIVFELYVKLVDSAKIQLIWVTKEMIDVSSVGLEDLIVTLLRRIGSGDYGDQNVWLCSELVNLFIDKWDCLLEDLPLVLTSALYSFLRLLADHCRIIGVAKLENVMRLEIRFCVKMFREQLDLSLMIGRDLVRLFQDLSHVSEFREIWNDLVSKLSQIYQLKTSSRYFILRISPEMETQLRFLLGHVKLGSQKRHQIWFLKKFLLGPEKETLLIDIVRFVCCVIHPTNEIIRSEIMPRWAVLGWLLELCRQSHHIERSVKLALFYDWLFFDEKMDNIMNVEPAALLMVWSIPQYPHITHSLLEFLLHLADTYDISHRDMIVRGVASAFREIERKEVVRSLDLFLINPAVAPELKKKLANLLSCDQENVSVPSKRTFRSSEANLKECNTKIVDNPDQLDNSVQNPTKDQIPG